MSEKQEWEIHKNWIRNEGLKLACDRGKYKSTKEILDEAALFTKYMLDTPEPDVIKLVKKADSDATS